MSALPLVWMLEVLMAAGCEVVEYPDWKTRARTDGGYAPRGVMWHHDASAAGPSDYVPAMMAAPGANGAQCWVDTAGVWHLIAAGRMWHAGAGAGWGRIRAGQGNTDSIGIETDHTIGEPWPDAQLRSLRVGTKALLAHLGGSPADSLCGHKEYTTRKVDPDGLDMNNERRIVAELEEDEMPWTESDFNTPLFTDNPGTPAARTVRFRDWAGELRAAAAIVPRLLDLLKTQTGITAEQLAAALLPGVSTAVDQALVDHDAVSLSEESRAELAADVVRRVGQQLTGTPAG